MSKDGKYDEKFSLDMPFGEALERFAKTDPNEQLEVMKENMSDDTIEGLIDAFEACSQHDENGNEFWYARDLQRLFDYAKWENFERVIKQAMVACDTSGHDVSNHWLPDARKSISGKGRSEEILDYRMSRYACYLTAQNADARKRPVAFAQTYFAIQTRRHEIQPIGSQSKIPQGFQHQFYCDGVRRRYYRRISRHSQGA